MELGTRRRTVEICERFIGSLERNAWIVSALMLLLFFVIAWGQSANKFLWYDELVTLKTASLPRWGDTWAFYANGLDTTGPVQSLVARLGLMLPIGPEMGSRLPFTFAYLIMCLCVYRFVHRCYPAGYALAAMIFFLNSTIFTLATEARAYALVLAGASIAMISWQSAIVMHRRALSLFGLWFGLALAFDAHPFAVFLFVPFALAQFLLDFRRKQPDWAIWISLVLFPAAYLPLLHGELIAKKNFGANFTSQPSFHSILASYPDYFFAWLSLPFVLLLTAAIGLLVSRLGRPRISNQEKRGFSLPEWVLVAMLALLPLYVGPVSFLLHIFSPRYVSCCVIGFVILAIAAVAETARRNRYVGAMMFLLVLLVAAHHMFDTFVSGLRALAHPDRIHQQLQVRFNSQSWMRLLDENQLPLVADCHLAYDQIDYYANPGLERRLNAVTNIRSLNRYPQTTIGQLLFLRASKELSYRTSDLADFLKAHQHFLLIGGFQKNVWMPSYLSDEQKSGNASVTCLGPDCGHPGITIYEVQFKRIPLSKE